VPFVALPYSGKVAGFLEDLDIAMPPLKQVNAGQLIAYIDRWWDLRRNLQARLEKSVPEIQARARRTNDIALRILREHQERREAEAGRRSRG
jgi:polysaccharide pyruvyl transferase WcaK-like protein